ncbi:hypothetical protein DFH06DRAFT_1197000 [Mycena polygramma]|nr:hypothetical protein DFH06DRAFT_1197000 [Mycena polygramma]
MSSEAHYDRSLLAQAPAASRAQRQEGYDHVLLAPNRRAKRTQSDLGLNEGSQEPKVPVAPLLDAPYTKPFWQRRWKALVAVVVVLVVIAAVVGGAVGATIRKKKPAAETVGIITASTIPAGQPVSSTSTTSSTNESLPSQSSGTAVATQPAASDSPQPTASSAEYAFVGVATETIPSTHVFVPRTPRHGITARRRMSDDGI